MIRSTSSWTHVRCALMTAGMVVATAAQAQSGLLARADSAFAAEDRSLARRLYEQVLKANPEQSRASFRLAQLQSSPAKAIPYYARYVSLEPSDPWGHMALGDQLARAGKVDAALASYDRAHELAPNERDVSIGRARIQSRAGRSTDAQQTLMTWTRSHPADGEAWDLLGRELLRSGRPRAAAQAFEKARAADPPKGVDARLRLARSESAPAIQPIIGYQRDSDGNSTSRSGLSADVMVADGTRLGAGFIRGSIRDALETNSFNEATLTLQGRPTADVRFSVQGGLTAFTAPAPGTAPTPGSPPVPAPGRGPGSLAATQTTWTEPLADVRLRWRRLPNAPALELRAQHLPLATAPLLVANRVTRSDARATLELPVGALRLRGTGRAGAIRASGETANRRLDGAAALALPLGSAAEFSARYQAVSYAHESSAGYFAPRAAETMEGTAYFDFGGDGPLSIAADLGAGMQRTALQGEAVGRWKAAFRVWTYSSLAMGPGRALWLEIEAYDAPFAPLGVAAAPSWRYIALTTGLRWTLR
ncbi:MAG TPA: tetratricopeptide repeat protein [Gemmatimonadaceae bacterium]|nr:tetratricopeptide repeat protein [Gemmatimonadaceae bacterium]